MDASRWALVREILESALEKSAPERQDYVERACAGDEAMKAAVLTYISAHSEGGYLEAAGLGAFPELARDPWTGRQLGAWLLEDRIGEGGMGAVYSAVRADHQYEQRAAVKLVGAVLNADAARRFRNERQLLARLVHPNIARLLDGGVSEEGVPYLVMEFVEGVPIDRYCADRGLSVNGILTLFREVCSAVEHAHGNLIVHRDIKPGNILVTEAGVPKLLDFGIAKLLNQDGVNQDGEELTRTSQRPMTLAYASPEQVMGEPVTTATDVYSLGVLLYRLLTGRSPYPAGGDRGELERAILGLEPQLPCTAAMDKAVRLQLRGDLDAIVMTALRKDAARRYPSVGRLRDDIAAYQQGLPVSARTDGAFYRGMKFARRHRVAVSAVMAAALVLITATVVSVNFARQAEKQRAVAQARFQETRSLANFFLFDFDDAIREGTTAARRSVVSKGLEYLDRLGAASRGDVSLERELLAGYSKIATLQGNLFDPNLGDVAGARASYRHALEIAQQIRQADPDNPRTRRDLGLVYQHLGEIEGAAGNFHEAMKQLRQALPVLDAPVNNEAPVRARDKESMAAALEIHARMAWVFYRFADYAEALKQYDRYSELAREFYGASPADPAERRSLVYAKERRGETLARMEQTPEGLSLLEEALAGYRALAAGAPGPDFERDVIAVCSILGDLLGKSGHPREALVYLREAQSRFETMLAGDPRNKEIRRDLAETQTVLADVLNQTGRSAEARAVTGRALQAMRENLGTATQWDLFQYARLLLDTPFPEFRNNAEALRFADKTLHMTDGSDPSVLDLLARALDATGDHLRAVKLERSALNLLPPGPSDLRTEISHRFDHMEARLPTPPAERGW